jgi:hypothetical protein
VIVPLLLAAALVAAPDGGGSPAPTAAPPDDAEPAEASPPPALPGAGRQGTRHAVGLGLHSTTFFSEEGSQYTFHSASFGYLGSRGARGPFLQAFALLPLQARQDGRAYPTSDYYSPRAGADLLVGWQWRWTVRGNEAEAGPGVHTTVLWLPARSGYRDFSAVPLGLGGSAALRWHPGARVLSRPVTLGAYVTAALDLYDPTRAGDLDHGFTFRAGMMASLGARR